MSIALGKISLDSPVFLAPMAGITDLPFRNLVRSFGAGLVVSEMVASQEMVQAKPGVRERAELGFGLEGTAVQLAGRAPYWIGEAARMVEASGAKIIDINMGCPAKKVVGGLSGSALLKEPDRALRLIEAVVDAVAVPVTLKTRLGWDDDLRNAPAVARAAEAAGVRMVTIHGRTRAQFYKGRADWAAIAETKQALTIPVIANGDICSTGDARRALAQSGADGVMVGRATGGRPWLIAEIAAGLTGGPDPDIPQAAALVEMVRGHYDASLSFYGKDLGKRVIRKHLGWYMDHAGTPQPLRRDLLSAADPARVHRLIAPALEDRAEAA